MSLSLPFERGAWVVLVLREPREQIWGRLLGLEPAGVALRGLDLRAWEEVIRQGMAGELDQMPVATRFYPLHRIESLQLDEPFCGAPSLESEFRQRTGHPPETCVGDLP